MINQALYNTSSVKAFPGYEPYSFANLYAIAQLKSGLCNSVLDASVNNSNSNDIMVNQQMFIAPNDKAFSAEYPYFPTNPIVSATHMNYSELLSPENMRIINGNPNINTNFLTNTELSSDISNANELCYVPSQRINSLSSVQQLMTPANSEIPTSQDNILPVDASCTTMSSRRSTLTDEDDCGQKYALANGGIQQFNNFDINGNTNFNAIKLADSSFDTSEYQMANNITNANNNIGVPLVLQPQQLSSIPIKQENLLDPSAFLKVTDFVESKPQTFNLQAFNNYQMSQTFQQLQCMQQPFIPSNNLLVSPTFDSSSYPFVPPSFPVPNASAAPMFSTCRFPVIRGISSGGSAARPPKSINGAYQFRKVKLNLIDASTKDNCYPEWSKSEIEDRRRIIRIERRQEGSSIIAEFKIIGSANENPTIIPHYDAEVDVLEVSCLECSVNNSLNDEYSDSESEGYYPASPKENFSTIGSAYYITSVEVVKIVELLIGFQNPDPEERRRERGRIRSNLVPFWSKRPIFSKKTGASCDVPDDKKTNEDLRIELARRIMDYKIRKPRGFDKEVRILSWNNLIPALERALQSYYIQFPADMEI
ncbi:hypothetical protein B5S31_g4901 [[Candida] boidinii]|uniref:Unnamed protein product n=1 Tax=Candida boidinii TaxID=5477 RepID=A0ACB5TKH9_CANBO|nr:hypothetical protein B5S31_g4901 [[Candida] boidinii]OWB78628.1 hypothetical protein B5S32_g2826 [[Candida] boidinii]GME90058.1 unnamed protein product [[Candida] boidinii]